MNPQRDDADDVQCAVRKYNIDPKCEFCASTQGLKLESSRTAYPWEGQFDSPDDPNRNKLLCRHCAKEHHEYWDAMWKDYYSSRF